MNFTGRIISFLVAFTLCLSLSGGLSITASAAAGDPPYYAAVSQFDISKDGSAVSMLIHNAIYVITIRSYDLNLMLGASASAFDKLTFSVDSGSTFIKTNRYTSTTIPSSVKFLKDSAGDTYVELTLPSMRYVSTGSSWLMIEITDARLIGTNNPPPVKIYCGVSLPEEDSSTPDNDSDSSSGNPGNGDSGSSGDNGFITSFTSDIMIENISVTDSAGKTLDRVTKDTPPFNIQITYADYGKGLNEVNFRSLSSDESLEVFLTNVGSFIPSGGAKGTIRALSSSSTYDVPRFRVDFKDLTWDGASNAFSFQPRYNIFGVSVPGSGGNAVIYQARTQAEEEKEADIPPPTPYIIVSQYSFGDEDIEAGADFTLDVSFRNTSDSIPLENIVMTITTPEDMSIASASNTYYISALGAGETMPYSIDLGVKPNASVGSHGVQIGFTYQYISGKERKENKTTENIAIPITQIDRFSVDPVTEIPPGFLGEAAYMPVSFINRGKSTTYNITGTASANLDIIVQPSHYGNLEPGKSDSIDVTIVPQQSGELFGEIIVQYEDENTNQKEIRIPFTMFVQEPYVPDFSPPPPDFETAEPPQPNRAPTIVLCITGGLLIAGPIMLYLIKRVKAKGSEDFDEDF